MNRSGSPCAVSVAAPFASSSFCGASACGIQPSEAPPGTTLQVTMASERDHPWLCISHPAVSSAKSLSGACHGRLIATSSLGFRYMAGSGFLGDYGFSFLACTAGGRCIPERGRDHGRSVTMANLQDTER